MRAVCDRSWKRWSSACWSAYHPSHATSPRLLKHESHDAAPTTLKGELRRLYKLIHPDLLHNQPVEQATNQKSFQLLQEYLNAAKGGDGTRRYAYHFEFYIRGKASDDSLEKVEVSLPPPQARGKFHQEQEILPTTRRAIGQLFVACGLSSNFTADDERPSLSTLFQEASELQRQNEASRLSLQQQLSMISNALSLGRGVRHLFRAPVQEAHLDVQVQLLEKLAKSLDAAPGINLSGSTFVFGNGYKLDFLGRLWLNYEDNVVSWAQFIRQADLVTASARRLAAKSRQVEEERVAQLMGVQMVFTNDDLALHPDYTLFLQRVGDGAAEHGAAGGGRFSELPVRVREVEVPMVDEDMGFLTVPFRIEFMSLYKFIEENGDKALGHRREMKFRERKLEDLRKHVRTKLRLRHLKFDRKLSPDQLMSACTRLSSHAPKLAMYTEGLSLCISDEYRLPTEELGSSVYMKWNFKLEDL